MSLLLKTAAVAAAVLITPAVAAAQTWADWGEAEGRELIAAENGVVDEVTREADGSLRIYGTMDGWLAILLVGSECQGEGAKLRCKELGFNSLFEVDDAVRSLALERELDFRYVSDVADGEDLVIHRQVELTGGASLVNIRAQMNAFIVVGELVAAKVWPVKAGASASAKAP